MIKTKIIIPIQGELIIHIKHEDVKYLNAITKHYARDENRGQDARRLAEQILVAGVNYVDAVRRS